MSDKTTGSVGVSKKKKYRHVRYDLSEEQILELREAFDVFDENGDGTIPNSQVKIILRALGYEPKRDEVKRVLSEIDPDKEGVISFSEFVQIMNFKLKEKDSKDEMMRAFKLFDDDNTGSITFKNLKRVSMELGQNLSEEEIKEMIDEADMTGNGQISPSEFMNIMKKANLL